MKKSYPLKICPWCHNTPRFRMDVSNATWLPRIICENYECFVNPKTKYIPIRKTQRQRIDKIREKIERLVKLWNDANLDFKSEGFCLDYQEIVNHFLSDKIGLPGYRQEGFKGN